MNPPTILDLTDESEDEIKANIRKFFGLDQFVKLFNQPVGTGWVGKDGGHGDGFIKLLHPRRVAFGMCVGSSDLIGWLWLDGRAIFFALEIKKRTGKLSDEQRNFLQTVRDHGGIAGVARCVADVEYLIYCFRNGLKPPELK